MRRSLEYEDAFELDPEFERYWHAPENQVTHTCEGCGCSFTGHFSRGDLGYCNRCADAIEGPGCF